MLLLQLLGKVSIFSEEKQELNTTKFFLCCSSPFFRQFQLVGNSCKCGYREKVISNASATLLIHQECWRFSFQLINKKLRWKKHHTSTCHRWRGEENFPFSVGGSPTTLFPKIHYAGLSGMLWRKSSASFSLFHSVSNTCRSSFSSALSIHLLGEETLRQLQKLAFSHFSFLPWSYCFAALLAKRQTYINSECEIWRIGIHLHREIKNNLIILLFSGGSNWESLIFMLR